MRSHPLHVFSSDMDLGSGSSSPIEFDFTCSESLKSFDFMNPLLRLAEKIRGNFPGCGTLDSAQFRYHAYALAMAGIAPEIFFKEYTLPAENEYFMRWSEMSLYNNQAYHDFWREAAQVKASLTQRYRRTFRFSRSHAAEVAQSVVAFNVYASLRHTQRTPLMHAAQNSDVVMLKVLVARGARLADVDELGFNALDYAILGKNPENQGYLTSLGLVPQKMQLGEDFNPDENSILSNFPIPKTGSSGNQ